MYDVIKYRTFRKSYSRSYCSHREKDLKNSQSRNTKDFSLQAQHQLNFTVKPKYTSLKTIGQLVSYQYDLLSPTLTQDHINL